MENPRNLPHSHYLAQIQSHQQILFHCHLQTQQTITQKGSPKVRTRPELGRGQSERDRVTLLWTSGNCPIPALLRGEQSMCPGFNQEKTGPSELRQDIQEILWAGDLDIWIFSQTCYRALPHLGLFRKRRGLDQFSLTAVSGRTVHFPRGEGRAVASVLRLHLGQPEFHQTLPETEPQEGSLTLGLPEPHNSSQKESTPSTALPTSPLFSRPSSFKPELSRTALSKLVATCGYLNLN